MTIEQLNDTKLLSNNLEAWNQVDWKKVRKEVRRLRSRIFKCVKQNQNEQVISLQKLMIKSSSNILWSIRKVCAKPGRYSPGTDGMTVPNATRKFKLR
jgi:RNA-directed DNA polymerase